MTGFWGVAQTETRREATAARFLADQGFVTYLPRIRVQKRVQPLFPSYLFVRIESRWWNINQTIGVIALLTTGDAPARLRDNVIEIIKAKERGGIVRLPDPNQLRSGARVRITRGSFEGHIAIYQGMSGKDRERVLLNLLGRKVLAEVHKQDLVPAPDLA
jgi:transcription elongation factor/antiterminator RfaH